MFLTDHEISELLAQHPTLVAPLREQVEPGTRDHPVQPSSIDLCIGEVYVPNVPSGKLGAHDHPYQELYSLEAGKTAVVRTKETCDFPSDIGGIGFPPSHVSAKGILMTNPGHVDPGYHGRLSFTVINMGSQTYHLAAGDPIVSMLLFRLGRAAEADYAARNPGTHGEVREELLARLSPDFLDVDRRARKAAATEESKTRRWGLAAPIIVGLLTFGGVYVQTDRAHKDDIQKLQQDIKVLQTKLEAKK